MGREEISAAVRSIRVLIDGFHNLSGVFKDVRDASKDLACSMGAGNDGVGGARDPVGEVVAEPVEKVCDANLAGPPEVVCSFSHVGPPEEKAAAWQEEVEQ